MKARGSSLRMAVVRCCAGVMLGVALAASGCAPNVYADSDEWTIRTDSVQLGDLWSHAVAGTRWDVDDARLTTFQGYWAPDGSLYSLQLWAMTSDLVEMNITVSHARDAGTADVRAQVVRLKSAPSTTAVARLGIYQAPEVTQVLASIDAAGSAAMAKGTSLSIGTDDLVSFVLADRLCPAGDACLSDVLPGERPIYVMSSGTIMPVKRTAPLSSVAPAQLFYVAKATWNGGNVNPDPATIAWCFVR